MKKFLLKSYKNKKVLVTGATGFKGSWLCLFLGQLGADVAGFGLCPDTNPSLYQIIALNGKIQNTICDIRDKNSVEKLVKNFQPDIIFHLAAQPLVKKSYENPLYTFETNVLGSANLFEICKTIDFDGVIVNITSDKVYKNSDTGDFYDENSPLGGEDPYSASKSAAEIVANSYRKSFGLKIASARAGNVIGGGDWAKDRLLPDIIRALVDNEEIAIRNPDSTRPWQHVIECIMGYLLLGANLLSNNDLFLRDWNFSSNKSKNITVEEIVSTAINIWGQGKYKIIQDNTFKEAKYLGLNTEKAFKYLGWSAIYDINTTLEKTISWYKKYYSSDFDMFRESISDIQEYIDILPVLNSEKTGIISK